MANNGTQKRGMGRGLAAILSSPSPTEETSARDLISISPQLVDPNPEQPRGTFDDEALSALVESIRISGVLQPILVRKGDEPGRYVLIAGERRLRASKLAGLETVPAVVQEIDNAQSLELALIENMVREDLSPVEEARACAALIEDLGLTREEVGNRVGRNRVTISNLIRLLDLPDDVLAMLESGELSEGHGRAILGTEDVVERRRLAQAAVREQWSVREIECQVRELRQKKEKTTAKQSQLHPDQVEVIERASDGITQALGVEAKVKSHKDGYRVQIDFDSSERMFAFVSSLGIER